jgi:hypothetical protein
MSLHILTPNHFMELISISIASRITHEHSSSAAKDKNVIKSQKFLRVFSAHCVEHFLARMERSAEDK